LAASSTDSTTEIAQRTASPRVTFAKLGDPIEVPDLLSLQTTSFDWLLGNSRWQERAAEASAAGREDVPQTSGLADIFEEISPIEDFAGNMALSFRDHTFDDPKYSVAECKEKDLTYAAPLYVIAEFMNNETGEIKTQTVFMGDFPLMTDKGTFIINGTERVVVSQLVRSPGVYFEESIDKTSDKHIFSAKVIRSSSRSTSATRSACASTASASSRSPRSCRRSVCPRATSSRSSASSSPCARPSRRTASPRRTRPSWTSTASSVRASRPRAMRARPC
jgi:DNA-directed RNA polymerase subunit beta